MASSGSREARRGRLAGLALALWAAAGAGEAMAQTQERADLSISQRRRMVEDQIRRRGVEAPEVLGAMSRVPRHLFVPEENRADAYADQALPIGAGQTISQPYIVGLMTSLLAIDKGSRVLEIGTGSGYQAAVLGELASEVYTIEILAPLADRARKSLADLGYANVHVRTGDGYRGWPDRAPFDAILVTAAPPTIPDPLIAQLKVGGHMVLPLGQGVQDLLVLTKRPDGGFDRRSVLPVRFVPMTGEVREPPAPPNPPRR